jgi:hypothetical protein
MISVKQQRAARLHDWLRSVLSRAAMSRKPSTGKCTGRRWAAGLAALVMWHCHIEPAFARTEPPKHDQQDLPQVESPTSAEKTLSSSQSAASCTWHEVVAISTQMIAIVTRAGDTFKNLQDCYSFDIQRTNAANDQTTGTFYTGQIILLLK